MISLDIARGYISRGWCPVPIPHGRKGPVLDGWQKLRITYEEARHYFNGCAQNIGVILGLPSGGLVDVDLDCPQALRVAPFLLPPTSSVFGRAGKPRSHRLFTSGAIDPETSEVRLEQCPTAQFRDPTDNAMLVELRGDAGENGSQTVFPGSTHESGEPVEWDEDDEPAIIRAAELRHKVSELAAIALLAKHWPAGRYRDEDGNEVAGGRHSANLKLAGWLTRAGWAEERVAAFLERVSLAAGAEPDRRKRQAIAADAAKRARTEGRLYGWPALVELFGDRIVARAAEWLEIGAHSPGYEKNEVNEESRRTDPLNSFTSFLSYRDEAPPWPKPLGEAAFYGLAGDVVRAIEPYTEADPAAILLQFLAAFGNAVGRGPYFAVEGDQHATNINAVLVGETAKGRKGTAWGRVHQLFKMADLEWASSRVVGGLSSGEGLIWQVRDAIERIERNRKTKAGETVVVDPGVTDKRLLVIEPELASVLRVMSREGNTLSAVVRSAWDTGNLRSLTKNSPAVATGSLISIVGHITADELRQELTRTDAANGFANRFLYGCVRRSKCLPDGGGLVDLDSLATRLAAVLDVARHIRQVCRDAKAKVLWHQVYPELSEGKAGLFGAAIGRAEAQVLRLSVLYALLDGLAFVEEPHLRAALEVWGYCEASARWIFGDSQGDPIADTILASLRNTPTGLTRTDVFNLFGRNVSAERIGPALTKLAKQGRIVVRQEQTAGRSREVWQLSDGVTRYEENEVNEKR